MSRQLNFFMTYEDETEFCNFVISDRAVFLVLDRVTSLPPLHLTPPLPSVDQDAGLRDLILWNRQVAPGPEYHWHHMGFYSTAAAQQGGMEFTRSVQDGTAIRSGRLWTVPDSSVFIMLDGNVRDPGVKATYDRWVNRLFRWIRTHYVKHSYLFYIGPGACRFQEMGGKLRPAYPEMDDPSKIERRMF